MAFANGMMNVIINEGLADEEFIRTRTEGFEELKEIVKEYTPERVAEICHIDSDHLREAALMYAKAKKAPIIYCLGVTSIPQEQRALCPCQTWLCWWARSAVPAAA